MTFIGSKIVQKKLRILNTLPIGLKEDRHIYIKGVTDALVLTVYELRNFKLSVKNKATGTPQGVYYIYALKCHHQSFGLMVR